MSDPEKQDYYHNDICLFCGNKAKEVFHQDNRSSYNECKCEGRLLYWKCLWEYQKSVQAAKDRYEKAMLMEQKVKTERELASIIRRLEKQ